MRKTVTNLSVIAFQLLIVVLFFATVFNNDIKVERYVNVIHNNNSKKIATSVSLLFEDALLLENEEEEEMILKDLPSLDELDDVVKSDNDSNNNSNNDEVVVEESTPLYSIDAGKYISNVEMGFVVTEGNIQYNLNDNEFNTVVAVVSTEFDKDLNDALGVVSVILNRCDSDKWSNWAGNSPYDQVIMPGQFEVYSSGAYLEYMPSGSKYGTTKYEIAKQAVLDGLNGIRNNEYLGFRAWWVSNYSSKYIVSGGNRYGYN